MKAAFIDNPGPPEAIRYDELPTPKPGQGEVLVKVAAVSVNPIDLYIRSGMVSFQLPKPFVIGCDLAGAVEQVGPGVKNLQVGDRVWGSNQGLLGRQGTFAEYASVKEEWLYPTPAGVDDPTVAAGALVGITAHLGLFRCAQLKAGETVFVNGGTGGVGAMVVQMVKAAGAKVIATVGSPEKAELCKKLGASHTLNYKSEDVAKRVAEIAGPAGVNIWFETQREPDFVKTFPLLAKRGRMIVMAGRQAQPTFPLGGFYPKDLSLFGFAMFNATPEEQRACADDMNRWYAAKTLTVPMGKTFKLSEAAAAHQFLDENTLGKAGTLVGKVVLTP